MTVLEEVSMKLKDRELTLKGALIRIIEAGLYTAPTDMASKLSKHPSEIAKVMTNLKRSGRLVQTDTKGVRTFTFVDITESAE